MGGWTTTSSILLRRSSYCTRFRWPRLVATPQSMPSPWRAKLLWTVRSSSELLMVKPLVSGSKPSVNSLKLLRTGPVAIKGVKCLACYILTANETADIYVPASTVSQPAPCHSQHHAQCTQKASTLPSSTPLAFIRMLRMACVAHALVMTCLAKNKPGTSCSMGSLLSYVPATSS